MLQQPLLLQGTQGAGGKVRRNGVALHPFPRYRTPPHVVCSPEGIKAADGLVEATGFAVAEGALDARIHYVQTRSRAGRTPRYRVPPSLGRRQKLERVVDVGVAGAEPDRLGRERRDGEFRHQGWGQRISRVPLMVSGNWQGNFVHQFRTYLHVGRGDCALCGVRPVDFAG